MVHDSVQKLVIPIVKRTNLTSERAYTNKIMVFFQLIHLVCLQNIWQFKIQCIRIMWKIDFFSYTGVTEVKSLQTPMAESEMVSVVSICDCSFTLTGYTFDAAVVLHVNPLKYETCKRKILKKEYHLSLYSYIITRCFCELLVPLPPPPSSIKSKKDNRLNNMYHLHIDVYQ